MRRWVVLLLFAAVALEVAAQSTPPPASSSQGTIAEVYFWKAKPGKLDEYNKYIKEIAEPIDHEAQGKGAFISITTYLNRKPDAVWTHMRVFILRDAAQQQALAKALDDAGVRLHPDQAERDKNSAYAATLRDPAGHETVEVFGQ